MKGHFIRLKTNIAFVITVLLLGYLRTLALYTLSFFRNIHYSFDCEAWIYVKFSLDDFSDGADT